MKYIKNTLVLFTCDKLGPYENFGIITKSAPKLFPNYKIGPCDLISKKPNGLFILLPKTKLNLIHTTSPPSTLFIILSPCESQPNTKTKPTPFYLKRGQPSGQPKPIHPYQSSPTSPPHPATPYTTPSTSTCFTFPPHTPSVTSSTKPTS